MGRRWRGREGETHPGGRSTVGMCLVCILNMEKMIWGMASPAWRQRLMRSLQNCLPGSLIYHQDLPCHLQNTTINQKSNHLTKNQVTETTSTVAAAVSLQNLLKQPLVVPAVISALIHLATHSPPYQAQLLPHSIKTFKFPHLFNKQDVRSAKRKDNPRSLLLQYTYLTLNCPIFAYKLLWNKHSSLPVLLRLIFLWLPSFHFISVESFVGFKLRLFLFKICNFWLFLSFYFHIVLKSLYCV